MKLILNSTIVTLALAGSTALAADVENPNTGWVSSAAAGLTLTRGNSETLLGTVNFDSSKKWDQHEIRLGGDITYGVSTVDDNDPTTDDEKTTANAYHAFGQYNHLFSERFYGYGRLDALHDGVAKVDYRLTISPGAGYYLIKEERMDLSVEGGPSYITERLNGEHNNYFALRVAEQFNWKINDRARIWQKAELLPEVEDFDNYLLNFEIGIESDLTKSLSLRSFIQDTYDNVPAEGRKKNDLKWVTAIAYKF